MRFIYLQHIPYRHLSEDFATRFPESVRTTPYFGVVEPRLVHADIRAGLDESMHAARAGFDAVGLTEHGQSSYDMDPNPDLGAAALAYQIGAEDLNTGIYVVGRSLGKTREPLRVAEELAWLDHLSAGRLMTGFPVGLPYDANINAGIPPIETRARYDENLSFRTEGMDRPRTVRVERQVFAVHVGERLAASLPGTTSACKHYGNRESEHNPIRPTA